MTETSMTTIGQLVPDFNLEAYNPKTRDFQNVSLQELKKKQKWTILVFYPADFTFVCPTELADVAANLSDIEKENAEVISVSTDNKFVHLAWQREEPLLKDVKFLMGADTTGTLARQLGVYDEQTGLTYRGTFIINPEGRLVGSEVNFYNVGRNASELVRKVRANAYLMDHPAEVCPANWDKGAQTLTPGKDLVGRVGQALSKN